MTLVTSKQLLPIYDKPMIYYSLATLMLAGIREILVITTPKEQEHFKALLGDGAQWGIQFDYAIQPNPEGLAQAFVIAEKFLGGCPSCLVLGDNLLYGDGLSAELKKVAQPAAGATVFGYRVEDPGRYGVITFDSDGCATSIEEKPAQPRSNWAVIGLYFYDETVVERAKGLKRSKRDEYEITDLNRSYLDDGLLRVERLGRGYAWFDAGTHAALLEAGEFVHVLQRRQGHLIASPEEISFSAGWITAADLAKHCERFKNTEYGRKLAALGQGA